MTPAEVIPFSRSQRDVKLKYKYICNLGGGGGGGGGVLKLLLKTFGIIFVEQR